MKKPILIAFMALLAFSAKSQSYGSHVDLYANDLLVNPDNVKPDDIIRVHSMKKITSKWDAYSSDRITYKKFVDDTLEVIQIQPYKDDIAVSNLLILKSHKTGALYEFQYIFGIMPFKVAKQQTAINDAIFCSDIHESTDRFTGSKNVTSPDNPIQISKFTKEGQGRYFISCVTGCPNPDGINKTGVIFLFSDGSKKEFAEAKIDVKVSESQYVKYLYSTNILLSNDDLTLFSEKRIVAFRLYIADTDVSEFCGIMYQSYLRCLLK